jgi:hypothetical protein
LPVGFDLSTGKRAYYLLAEARRHLSSPSFESTASFLVGGGRVLGASSKCIVVIVLTIYGVMVPLVRDI